jgi:hypothetical protein
MATRTEITNLRLLVNDPPGFVLIAEVANLAALPADPTQQTCYYLQDAERYVSTHKETGAVPDDYETQRIRISDAKISSLVDALGADSARCRVLRLIATKLGADMQLASTAMGGDETGYTSLRQMHEYYRRLAEDCEAAISEDAFNASGRVGHTPDPQIAGGLL